MDERLIFYPLEHAPYVKEERVTIPTNIKFENRIQKQEGIKFLHGEFEKTHPEGKILEISTKSMQPTGVLLSAFNLQLYVIGEGKSFPVENVYQSSKVFENGNRYRDLLYVSPKEAKMDARLVNSGKVVKYIFESREYAFDEITYPCNPKEAFFNYIYMTALMGNASISDELLNYDAFSDIEFDPTTGVNCQAKAAAEFVGRRRAGVLNKLSDVYEIIDSYV